MKRNLLLLFLACSLSTFANKIPVTTATFVDAYTNANNGDTLLLDAGTYSTAVNFPLGKIITLQKLSSAATLPLLTFAWTTTTVPTAGSGLILDSLEISLNNSYYVQFPANSVLDKFVFKNCLIGNINRCLVRASNTPTTIGEITVDNCIIKDCGSGGYCLIYSKAEINYVTLKNSTLYNYQGEGFHLSSVAQANTLVFSMTNNTLYQCGKDGAYSWCTITLGSGASSTYDISNNIISKPYTAVSTRNTILVPAGSGTVTCKNNLVIDYPNFSVAPLSGWDAANNTEETGTNYFTDAANYNFTLVQGFSLKGTDGKIIGDPRWSKTLSSAKNIIATDLKLYPSITKGIVNIEASSSVKSIDVISLNGRKVANFSPNKNKSAINLASLCPGQYILIITSKTGVTNKKIQLVR